MDSSYLIFVISFTQAKFRRIKFTPKNVYTKGVNCQIITQKSINFAFNLHWTEKIYTAGSAGGAGDKYEVCEHWVNCKDYFLKPSYLKKTSQELRMLSSITLNCR